MKKIFAAAATAVALFALAGCYIDEDVPVLRHICRAD